jgi:predicted metalloprotease
VRLDNERESSNIEDRRGSGGLVASGGKIGLGTIALALVAMYFGVDPNLVLNGMGAMQPPTQQTQTVSQPANDEMTKFVSMVLADTEDTWHDLFAKMGKVYEEPKFVLFSGETPTACGTGQAAMGPFYCPGDHKVYIDLSFYQELKDRFHTPGEFAEAYVIAHEVGHHVQNLLGISEKVQSMRSHVGSEAASNALSVKMELQADCLAGVWAFHANQARSILEQGDIESAINAATAIGDDKLQKQALGYAVPESFTHGSSAQRVEWFTRGIQQGDIKQCNTFAS